jgi:geranylgeranyl pyrophosphate synthase
LLAGDGLLTRAFGVICSNKAVSGDTARDAVLVLSRAAGSFGMIGGQVMDLSGEHKKLPLETLKKLHAHKTGAMIEVSATLGCLAAGLSLTDPCTAQAQRYARGVGLAFQIVDDVLDVTADAALLGKPIGSDAENEKTTFLTYYTTDEALAYARAVTKEAKEALTGLPQTELLTGLADYLVSRNH